MIEFDIKKTVSYWFNGAKYDLSVANAMLKSKKYPYALFMGHLALEKLLKALVVKYIKAHAPHSHSLPYLAEKSGVKIPEEILIKLREFMEFHFEARYPDVTKAFYEKCTSTYTAQKLKEMKEVVKWIKSKL
ncbi:HEPN domain-containing protein [Patescibacteria group bacterium]|nr:HEPN domain-containing protein [Patescibacteria group bacterium]